MARAGFCATCNANVWLNEDGSCVNGHAADCVSGAYEAGQPAFVPVQPPANKNRTLIIVLAVVAVLAAVPLCGMMVAIAVPVFLNSSATAQTKSCYANQRVIEGAAATYTVVEEGKAAPTDWDELMSVLMGPYIKKAPTCPAGGTYELSAEDGALRASCSVHGSYEDEATAP